MILLWTARLLSAASRWLSRASDRVYRAHARREIAKTEAKEDRAQADRLIRESLTTIVGSPIHRDR